MALTENGGSDMVMPVAPMSYGYGNGGGFGGGWSSDWWILFIILFAFGGFGGWGNGGWGNGNAVADLTLPYFFNNTDNGVQAGFNQAATNTALAGIQTSLTNGFANAEVSACNRAADAMMVNYNNQIASMNQNFANQQALDARLGSMEMAQQNCCCENRLAVANLSSDIAREACADRQAVNDALNATLTTMSAGIQSIKDQMFNDKLDAKNEQISNLTTQLNMANLAASQSAQTAQLMADNNAQTQYIVNRVAPYPIPAYSVPSPYGNNGYGCINSYGYY